MEIVVTLLVLALVVYVACLIIDMLTLPGNVGLIAKLIIGVVALIYLLRLVLPIIGGGRLL